MIALDTNVLVRYVTNDDPRQAAQAVRLLSRPDDVFVPKTVLLELERVLRAVYNVPRSDVTRVFKHILGLPNVVVEATEEVAEALRAFDHGFDFADALHLAASQRADTFHTFDKALARKAGSDHEPAVVLERG